MTPGGIAWVFFDVTIQGKEEGTNMAFLAPSLGPYSNLPSSKGSGYAGPCRFARGFKPPTRRATGAGGALGGGEVLCKILTWIGRTIYVFFVALVIGSF